MHVVQAENGEIECDTSDAANDVAPPPVVTLQAEEENGVTKEEEGGGGGGAAEGDKVEAAPEPEPEPEEPKFKADNLDNRHLIKQIGPIRITSKPPDKPTRHRDVIQHVSANILSRPGSPVSWDFGVKESITTQPPRPQSASLLSPPEKRRAPISVDHTLRKHALDFS